jgi:hypothetical protein
MAMALRIDHARTELRAKMSFERHTISISHPQRRTVEPTANPTRVAIDELQLHDLQNKDAAVRRESSAIALSDHHS